MSSERPKPSDLDDITRHARPLGMALDHWSQACPQAPAEPIPVRLPRSAPDYDVDQDDCDPCDTDANCESDSPKTHIVLSSSSLESHRAMVMAGCGLSILPMFMVREDLAQGRLALFDETYSYQARLDLVQYRNRRPTPQAKAAFALMKTFPLEP